MFRLVLGFQKRWDLEVCIGILLVSESVFGLCDKVLVVVGATGVASMRNCQKLPPVCL